MGSGRTDPVHEHLPRRPRLRHLLDRSAVEFERRARPVQFAPEVAEVTRTDGRLDQIVQTSQSEVFADALDRL